MSNPCDMINTELIPEEKIQLKLYVDADGSPVVDIAVNLAKENNIEVIIVKNYAHEISDNYATVITVDIGPDSADYYIVNVISKGDIVVTQDYGLASLCLSKNAYPINQSGLVFTEDNIDGMLNRRYIHAMIRRQGRQHSNAKKRKHSEDVKFQENLESLIKENMPK